MHSEAAAAVDLPPCQDAPCSLYGSYPAYLRERHRMGPRAVRRPGLLPAPALCALRSALCPSAPARAPCPCPCAGSHHAPVLYGSGSSAKRRHIDWVVRMYPGPGPVQPILPKRPFLLTCSSMLRHNGHRHALVLLTAAEGAPGPALWGRPGARTRWRGGCSRQRIPGATGEVLSAVRRTRLCPLQWRHGDGPATSHGRCIVCSGRHFQSGMVLGPAGAAQRLARAQGRGTRQFG